MSSRNAVVLAVTGSIAAFKAAQVARLLVKAGVRVLPVMTRSATQFLGQQSLSGITSEPVETDMFDAGYAGEKHVALAALADLVAVVPATADVLARLAGGRADDLVTALCLCARCPVLVAPAMHPNMWHHPSTVRNVATLVDDGRVELIGPVHGEVASGEMGEGRMAEPQAIVEAILAKLESALPNAKSKNLDLHGARIVVTAGPTVEDIDPVRFLTNRSTGKMGFALAAAARARGADVRLIAGPVALPTPEGVERIDVRGALSMREALWSCLGEKLDGADVLVMSAAVGDYRPRETSRTKLKRDERDLTIDLVPNPDLLAEVGVARETSRRAHPVLVGFAVETADEQHIVELARGKLAKKHIDMVVANHASDSFGRDDNRAVLVDHDSATPLETMSKRVLADRILDRVVQLLTTSRGPT